MLRALSPCTVAVIATLSMWPHSTAAEDIFLPLVKDAHQVGVIGGLITEIPGLAAYDSDYVNPYEFIEDPDYLQLYEVLSSTSTYDTHNYADANLGVRAMVDPESMLTVSAAAPNNMLEVESSVEYARIYTYAYALAYGYFTVGENESYPTAGQDENTATANIALNMLVNGPHDNGNPTCGAVLYSDVLYYNVDPGYEYISGVYMEPLDSSGSYYTAVGQLQQFTHCWQGSKSD